MQNAVKNHCVVDMACYFFGILPLKRQTCDIFLVEL